MDSCSAMLRRAGRVWVWGGDESLPKLEPVSLLNVLERHCALLGPSDRCRRYGVGPHAESRGKPLLSRALHLH